MTASQCYHIHAPRNFAARGSCYGKMKRGVMLRGLAVAVLVVLPARAQQPPACNAPWRYPGDGASGAYVTTLVLPPCAGPSLPPIAGKAPPVNPPPANPPEIADHLIPSTDLGYEQGIGPAPGWAVTWRGSVYVVVYVTAREGRPTFTGGSRYIITTAGGVLDVGLKAIAKDALAPEMADAISLIN